MYYFKDTQSLSACENPIHQSRKLQQRQKIPTYASLPILLENTNLILKVKQSRGSTS